MGTKIGEVGSQGIYMYSGRPAGLPAGQHIDLPMNRSGLASHDVHHIFGVVHESRNHKASQKSVCKYGLRAQGAAEVECAGRD